MQFKEIKNIIENYESNILNGKITCGELVRLGIERQRKDIIEAGARGFYFDEKAAARPIIFIETFLLLTKAKHAGKPFILADWQKWQLWVLFGWKNNKGDRRFRYA